MVILAPKWTMGAGGWGGGREEGRKEGKKGLAEDLEKCPGIVVTSLFLMVVFRVVLMFIENIMDPFFLYWPDFSKQKHLNIHRDISNTSFLMKKMQMLVFCTQICQNPWRELFQMASNVNYISSLKCVMKPYFLFEPPVQTNWSYLISAFLKN